MLEEKRWAFEREQLFFFFFFKIPSAVNAALQGPLKKNFFFFFIVLVALVFSSGEHRLLFLVVRELRIAGSTLWSTGPRFTGFSGCSTRAP